MSSDFPTANAASGAKYILVLQGKIQSSMPTHTHSGNASCRAVFLRFIFSSIQGTSSLAIKVSYLKAGSTGLS